ncbi:MAG TPA: tol-pal system-associated acyl-CoA thioesterase [Mariprofundaceae bacterium]|nr:tol-pal system-associated acyl-CoA thioesterase [Mariprofundaceae bacterium]
MTAFSHMLPVRIYYEDTDHGGVVYHANYLKYMERGRTEFLRTGGIELDELEAESGVLFAVTEIRVRYHLPARFNDALAVESALTGMRGARLSFHQVIRRPADAALLVEADVHVACIDRQGKARRIPESVKSVIRRHLTSPHAKEQP